MKKLISSAVLALFIMPYGHIANAQQTNCAPREAIIERLASGYGETRQAVGIGSNNAMIEVFANEETGSWSIIVTQAAGISCLAASGQSYEEVQEHLPEDKDDA